MNLTAIQTFLTVTRTGNLNRAADQLHVTQSTVTARLDRLEQSLGVKLLNRARNGATLTKEGYAFLEQAEVITRSWQTAQAQASLPKGVTQLFSFVCDPSLWPGLGDKWVSDLRQTQAGLAVDIWSGLATDARRWLSSGMSDAALLQEPLVGPEFDSRPFASERLVQYATVARKVSPRPRAASNSEAGTRCVKDPLDSVNAWPSSTPLSEVSRRAAPATGAPASSERRPRKTAAPPRIST